ncbi:MAG: putative metal-binding motif-containing protein [Myxococcaceae bacterium]
MSARWAVVVGVLVLASGCLTAWDVGGPWACPDSGQCPNDLVCDDGVCCQPGAEGKPPCPTLPSENGCPPGSMPELFYRDRDGDGAGDPNDKRSFCRRPIKEKWVAVAGDCNDNDVGIGPRAPERCNAIDDDCNGLIDDGAGLQLIDWKLDVDGDHFGDDCPTCSLRSCAQPAGYAALGGDCAPNDPNVFPGAPEKCNRVDDNCNRLVDDAPFADVESPGLDASVVADCDTGQAGECRPGGLQCLSLVDGGTQSACVPRALPVTDVCGNGKDDDCNGGVDDRPGCGGPRNLLTENGVTQGALMIPLPGTVPTRCLKNDPLARGMAWLNPVWIGSDVNLHVWWAEPPSGHFWDLSTARSAFFPIQSVPVNQAGEGTWATDPAGFPNAVVVLCAADGGVVRYVPTGARIGGQTTDLRIDVPLRDGGANWQVSGSAATLSQVARVEVWLSPRRPDAGIVTFKNIFLVDAGVPGFR